MPATVQQDLTITIDAPDGLPALKVTVWAHPETAEEFNAVVVAVGGFGAFRPHYQTSDYIVADLPGGHDLFLHEPKSERVTKPVQPHPFLESFSERVKQAREAAAESGEEA